MPHTKSMPPRTAKPFKKSVTEAGFSYTAMRDAHFRGELAVIKIGRAWYLENDELDRFVNAHRVRQSE